MNLPSIGEKVRFEYLNIDEIEAVCWLITYSKKAYMDNPNMKLVLTDIGKREVGEITSIDKETGRIELKLAF